MNYFFGYSNHPEKENPIAIFNYKDHNDDNLSQFEAFKQINKETMEWCAKRTETLKDIKYVVNKPGTFVKMDIPDYPEIILKSELKD